VGKGQNGRRPDGGFKKRNKGLTVCLYRGGNENGGREGVLRSLKQGGSRRTQRKLQKWPFYTVREREKGSKRGGVLSTNRGKPVSHARGKKRSRGTKTL